MNAVMTDLNLVSGLVGQYALPWAKNIFFALLIFIIGRITVKIIVSFASRLMHKGGMDDILRRFILSIVKSVLLLFVVIASLEQLGLDTTSLVALLGAAGLAVGLALKDSLANFSAGVMLIIYRPFTKGDYVEAGGTQGTVEEITLLTTMFATPDNKQVIVPNAAVFSGVITNYSAKPVRRVDMTFGVGYADDLKQAKGIIENILANDPRVLKDPAPTVAVGELADSSVNFVVRPWCNTADYWSLFFDTTEKVKQAFDEQNISIPFPQMDVHVRQPVEAGPRQLAMETSVQ